MSELSYFERTRIQMEYVVPLINGLKEVLGEETLLSALEQLNTLQTERAEQQQQADFSQMDSMIDMYATGDALKYEVIASSNDHFDLNIRNCRYAEMMEELGGRDFGHLLLCSRDFAGAKQLGMELTRTQTRMQGADHCDFRYRSARPETDHD